MDPQALIHRVTTALFDVVEDFGPVVARQMMKRVPALGSPDDEPAYEATRTSALGSMYELLCITRAGLTDPRVIETSPEALEHMNFLKKRGVGMSSVLGFYHIGFAMFEPLMAHELGRHVSDPNAIRQMAAPLRGFIFTYVDQITKRLAAEYGSNREGWVSNPDDPVWHDPDSVETVNRYLVDLGARERAGEFPPGRARAYTESALDRFCTAMTAASHDREMSKVLARANATVRIELMDEPDLFVTLLLDRDPIEVVEADVGADIEMSIVSVDLARLYSPDFHLAMAIQRGRVGYTGPVRKFLRVSPVVRHASLPKLLAPVAS
jgi:hypothetical protein